MPTIVKKQNTVSPIKWSKDQSHPYYNSTGWKNLRRNYIMMHPLCEECELKGISKPAEHVHHIRPLLSGKDEAERWKLLLDANNLQSLCKACHRDKHRLVFGNKTYENI